MAIANDPVNHGRGLLLERAGLITQREGVGYLGTLDDIIANPKDVQFPKVEGPQRVRITGDVDLAQGYPHFIVAAGTFDPTSGLIYSGIEDLQFNVGFVTRADRADNPEQFVEIFQSGQPAWPAGWPRPPTSAVCAVTHVTSQ
ncbi:MetQ/NlpA family ABC transporter substrate-binding protein [Paracoccus sp. PAMC 22219]|uniref:MetQ/NlpA family ABC transporter substrate-binding protein n=1 Tax=Paracoccus sp. PAMC 22219 TaxID=1569209 RepID=UPI000696D31E|nr:MetQ/NlpA family ABC transporter substrate-binding protein [Paracoccus sp. PAMC 22219]